MIQAQIIHRINISLAASALQYIEISPNINLKFGRSTDLQSQFKCLFGYKPSPKHHTRVGCIGATCNRSDNHAAMPHFCGFTFKSEFCNLALFIFRNCKSLNGSKKHLVLDNK
jgi:hypothetical protein